MEKWERLAREWMADANEWRKVDGVPPRTEEEMEAIIEGMREERKHPDFYKPLKISQEEINRRWERILRNQGRDW